MARSVVQTDAHLTFGFTMFKSNHCARVEESELDPVGRKVPVCVFVLSRFEFAPGFEITFPIHTNGTRPVKMPVPPRTCVRRSPTAFRLNPTRGANRGVAPGSLL